MPALFLYSIKLSFCLAVIYLFYHLVLRNLTFYNWNRWFLLISTGLSILIPLVNILPLLEIQKPVSLKIINVIPKLDRLSSPVLYYSNAPEFFNTYLYSFIFGIFGLGVLIQGSKLIVQFISFFRIRQSAFQLEDGNIKIYQVNKNIAPFSFGKSIFLNKHLLQQAELKEILRHELVHINQKHTLDVLWLECLCLFNWYNPFVWLIKRAARQNLEFIADRAVLYTSNTDKKYYQYLLLKVIGLPDFQIANQFNIFSLKTRIMMMNKMPSKKRELAKFLFVLPIMAILLLACQEDLSLAETPKAKVEFQNVLPPPPPPVPELPPPPPPMVVPAPPDYTLFMKRNPQVELLGWQGDKTAVIFLKTGEREEYNLNNPESKAKAEKMYGKFPEVILPDDLTQFTPPVIKKDK